MSQPAPRGLTARGRGLLAGGIAALLCGLILGEPDVLRVGGFLVALPLAAAVFVHRSRFLLGCRRALDRPRVPAGETVSVRVTVENQSRLPTGVVLFEDTLPHALGGRPRFGLDRLPPRARRTVTYPIATVGRGRYVLGPLTMRLGDPFGLCQLTRSFAQTTDLVVTPEVTALTSVPLPIAWAGDANVSGQRVTSQGEQDVTIRAYRSGDERRRVHWRSTARRGELMVRQEAQPWQARAVVLLDSRWNAHAGSGPTSSFEWAVSATASIGAHLAQRSLAARVITDQGLALGGPDGTGLLDALAVVHTSRVEGLTGAAAALRQDRAGLVIAVVGRLGPEDLSALLRVGRTVRRGLLLLLDVAGWEGGPTTPPPPRSRARPAGPGAAGGPIDADTAATAAALDGAGWQVAVVRRGARIADVWALLGRRDRAAAAPAPLAGRAAR